jgi:hypothetical protein
MYSPTRERWGRVLRSLLLAALTSCGGGGDGGNGPDPDPDPVVVTITPGRDTLSVAGSVQFQAAVEGSGNAGVTWTLREGATAGTISATGLYTAGTNSGQFGVIAVSQADPASKDTSLVLVVPLPVALITAPDSVLQDAANLKASVPVQSGTFAWSITAGTITGGNGTRLLTFTAGGAGPVQLQCVVTNLAGASETGAASTVPVAPPIIGGWSASRDTVTDGESVLLTPTFSGGTGAVDQGIGAVVSGTPVPSAALQFASTIFTLTVTGFRGATVTAPTTVTPVDPPHIFSFDALSRTTAIGDGAFLKALWLGDAGVTASVDHGVGDLSTSAFQTGPLSASTLFTLTVRNAADSAITDTVTAVAEPAATGSFATAGTLLKGRLFGTATRLSDGRILFAGGRDSLGTILTGAESSTLQRASPRQPVLWGPLGKITSRSCSMMAGYL